MAGFSVVRLPVLSEQGEWIILEPEKWNVQNDPKNLIFRITSGKYSHTLRYADVSAVEILEEKQVAAIGKTLGRMALSGAGAALLSKGSLGGTGAGLLDLRIKGVEQRSIVVGNIIFNDTGLLSFKLPGPNFGKFAETLPPDVFQGERLSAMSEMFGLIERMRKDGPRVLDEMVQGISSTFERKKELLIVAENGRTFAERDEARAEAEEVDDHLTHQGCILKALMYDLRVHPSSILETSAVSGDLFLPNTIRVAPQGAGSSASGSTSDSSEASVPSGARKMITLKNVGIAAVVIYIIIRLLHH